MKDPVSVARGYGPTCWEKEGRFLVNIPQHEEIEALRREVKALKELVANLQMAPQIPMPSHGLPPVPNGEMKERSQIALMGNASEYISELAENDLFLKMQAVCEVA